MINNHLPGTEWIGDRQEVKVRRPVIANKELTVVIRI